MFTYLYEVRLQDTDATGVLYFPRQFQMAMEAFEAFLKQRGFPLRQLLDSKYLMPVVHAEGDYLAPVLVGDILEVRLHVGKLGQSSLTLDFEIYDDNRKCAVGRVQIVHVTVDRETKVSVPVPDFLREILKVLLK